MTSTKRIFLIHATPVAMAPIAEAFARLWPEAQLCNLLEDSLSRDLRSAGGLTDDLKRRFRTLARYACDAGADAVLFTCSAFGEAIELSRGELDIPVLKPNEAMIEQALEQARKVGILATFEPSIASMTAEFQHAAQARGVELEIVSGACPQALEALHAGDAAGHDRLIAALAEQVQGCEVLCFSQFSMTSAAPAVGQASGRTVLTTPDSAVQKLRRLLL
ncbi:arylsulfatase [Pseudomonas sp. 10-1B]|uniref:aspartate/glutamate racemase family protein n=1 Tax=Pseudomonas sp. 10-1B TaxID=1546029 RepID=UPI0006201729|nr:aspartate/glutamate racemase family protein [Pseudomonas sp. 10-1B]KIY41251.1 arylsulfatase [Pseudomonas sp. 10-1B]